MDFGFKLSPSSTVNLDNVDFTLYDKLAQMEPDVRICMSCGSCGATCPAARYSGMSIRKIILGLQRGRVTEVGDMVKNCMLCGKCTMVCPRGINTRHLVLSLCRIYEVGDSQ